MAGWAQEPVTFEDVAVYLSRAEWEAAEEWQRELYRAVMVANYELLTSLGYPGPKPDILYRLERGEEPWVSSPQSPVPWEGPRSPSPGTDWLRERRCGGRPGADGPCAPAETAETPQHGGRCAQWRLRARRLLNKFRGAGGGSWPEPAATSGETGPREKQDRTGSWPGKDTQETEEREAELNQIQNPALRLHPGMVKQTPAPGSQDCVWGDPKERLPGGVQKRPRTSDEMRRYLGNERQRREAPHEVVLKDHCYCVRSKSQLWSGAFFLHLLRDHDYCQSGRDVAAVLRDHEYCQAQRRSREAQASGARGTGCRGAASADKSRARTRRLVKQKSHLRVRRLLRRAKRILWRSKRFLRKRLRFPPGSPDTDGSAEPARAEAGSPLGAEDNPVEGTCGLFCPPVGQETVPPQSQHEAVAQERPLEAPHGPAEWSESVFEPPEAAVEVEEAARPVLYVEHVLRRPCRARGAAAKRGAGGHRFLSDCACLHEAYGTVMRTVDHMLDRVCQAFGLGGCGQGKELWPVIIQIDS